MNTIIVDGLSVSVEHKANKNLYLRITPEGEVKATLPLRCSEETLLRFVRSKRAWIDKQLAAQTAQMQAPTLGQAHRDYLHAVLPSRVAHWEAALGVRVTEWRIRDMKTRWGTCNVTVGRVWFALMLAAQPLDLVDYIVLHELAHLIEPSHNARFQGILDAHMPDWRLRRRRLNGRQEKAD